MEKEQKVRYLAETLELVEDLIREAESQKLEENKKRDVSFCNKIKANTMSLLLRCGLSCYGDNEFFKSVTNLNISINQRVYEIPLQNIKTILSKDTDEIVTPLFHSSPVDNTITAPEKKRKEQEKKMKKPEEIMAAVKKNDKAAAETKKKNAEVKIEEDLLKELDEEEIKIIEIKEKMAEIPVRFDVKDLVMDVWTFEMKDIPGETYQILIAPIQLERMKKLPFALTFAIGIYKKESVAGAPAHKSRTSYDIRLNGKIFVIRGKWEDGEFSSIVYPLNMATEPYEVNTIHYRPQKLTSVGHPKVELDDKIFHFLPLSTRNEIDGYGRFILCVESKTEFQVTKNGKKKLAEIMMEDHSYQAFGKWEENIFLGYVQKS